MNYFGPVSEEGSSMARRRLVDGSSMARRRLVKVIGFLRPCKSATLRSHYPSPKAVPTSLCPSSAQALPKLPSLATPWVELGYTLGRVCEICSEHYTCRLACPRLNDSGSKENLRHNCATIVRVLHNNCSAVAQQSPTNHFFSPLRRKYFSSEEEKVFERRGGNLA